MMRGNLSCLSVKPRLIAAIQLSEVGDWKHMYNKKTERSSCHEKILRTVRMKVMEVDN
jgi:hypothetical protein